MLFRKDHTHVQQVLPDAEEMPRMAAGRDSSDEIPTCCGCINIRFLLIFLFTCLALLSAIELHRQDAFEYDRITFEIGFAWAVFAISLIGAMGTITESSAIMAFLTLVILVIALSSLCRLVYVTYAFYMIEENVETLKAKGYLNAEVRKEDMDGNTYVIVALPHALMVFVALAISGLTCALFDYYKD